MDGSVYCFLCMDIEGIGGMVRVRQGQVLCRWMQTYLESKVLHEKNVDKRVTGSVLGQVVSDGIKERQHSTLEKRAMIPLYISTSRG